MPELTGIPLLIASGLLALALLGVAIEMARVHRDRVEATRRRRINRAALHAASEAALHRRTEPPNPYVGADNDHQEVRQHTSR